MMTYATASKDKVKKYAEVFTPAGVVFEMILQENLRPLLADVRKTFFDPAVGEGQFPCAELVMKLFFNRAKLNEELALEALRSLHGMDLQAASVAKCHEHLLQTLIDSYKFFTGEEFTKEEEAMEIIKKNMVVGDSLKAAQAWLEPQQTLF